MAVMWHLVPFNLIMCVCIDQCFRGASCFHQDVEEATHGNAGLDTGAGSTVWNVGHTSGKMGEIWAEERQSKGANGGQGTGAWPCGGGIAINVEIRELTGSAICEMSIR
jgi:hypothetical protein